MHSERYSRFTLQTEQDGERRVEVKLSEEGVDGDAEDGAGGSPTFRPALRGQSKRSLCLHLVCTYKLYWLISKNTFITFILCSDFDRPSRLAGSADDTNLGNKIFEMFKELEMKPWTDVHHVRVQTPDSTKPNQVIFGLNVFKPQGYLAYSGTGKAQGPLVYANYGRPEDFAVLSNYKIDVKNCVVILRSGKISFAQKVANAEEKGAVAVLIYSDSQDYNYVPNTEVYGHVHLGSGDPYTPGFPSFNNTQFPPTKSAGLPNIPAQTITSTMAQTILQSIGGPVPDRDTGFLGGQASLSYSLGGIENITVEVSNTLVFKEIHNVFGVIKGFIDPDRYVVLGAQRDAWANGYASANVGTSTLIELAKVIRDMVEKDGFKPRRSIVFASWSAGEYGSIGATEWLEAYTASLDKSVLAYISLDGIVQGHGSFYASASPLLQNILDNAMKTVKPYPFLASSGIPSISFHFTSSNSDEYEYYNTFLDTKDHLDYKTAHKTSSSAAVAAQLAAQMALRLVHDHVLGFDVTAYKNLFNLKDVSVNWLYRAKASFQRAADAIDNDIRNTDLNDPEACRLLNDRIMTIEHSLLSPYASPIETPYRHMVFGKGPHTLAAIAEMTNMTQLHTELALATWNLQACANAMVGDLWELDNEI
uniref:Uncharacterized protein n=1 Tax=Periophthalmus magnuspinnatus TaxID=409849 RepID=A0A3B4AMI8_9GOBI